MLRHAVRALVLAAYVGATLVPFAGRAAAEAITDDNVAAMVSSADTAADRQALAEYFRAQAKQAEALAQKHRGMKLSHAQKGGSVRDSP